MQVHINLCHTAYIAEAHNTHTLNVAQNLYMALKVQTFNSDIKKRHDALFLSDIHTLLY